MKELTVASAVVMSWTPTSPTWLFPWLRPPRTRMGWPAHLGWAMGVLVGARIGGVDVVVVVLLFAIIIGMWAGVLLLVLLLVLVLVAARLLAVMRATGATRATGTTVGLVDKHRMQNVNWFLLLDHDRTLVLGLLVHVLVGVVAVVAIVVLFQYHDHLLLLFLAGELIPEKLARLNGLVGLI